MGSSLSPNRTPSVLPPQRHTHGPSRTRAERIMELRESLPEYQPCRAPPRLVISAYVIRVHATVTPITSTTTTILPVTVLSSRKPLKMASAADDILSDTSRRSWKMISACWGHSDRLKNHNLIMSWLSQLESRVVRFPRSQGPFCLKVNGMLI